MERSDLVKNYRYLNNSFRRKITFHLGADAGFFSEFNMMVLAILYCLDKEIKFTLYSKKGNFAFSKGWTDYFEPFCEESNLFLHSRYNRRPYQMKNANTLPPKVLKVLSRNSYLTQDIWDSFRSKEFLNTKFNIPELNLNDATIKEASNVIVKMIWQYNPCTKKIIEEYKHSIDLSNFISLHIRAGDKVKEANIYSPHQYMEVANSLNSLKSAFVLTDNYEVIDELKNSYTDWKFSTLCSPSERGYVHTEFTQFDKQQKYLQHLRLFASMEICAESDKFIGTYSSNPGMYMGMRIGEKKCTCLDYDSWVLG